MTCLPIDRLWPITWRVNSFCWLYSLAGISGFLSLLVPQKWFGIQDRWNAGFFTYPYVERLWQCHPLERNGETMGSFQNEAKEKRQVVQVCTRAEGWRGKPNKTRKGCCRRFSQVFAKGAMLHVTSLNFLFSWMNFGASSRRHVSGIELQLSNFCMILCLLRQSAYDNLLSATWFLPSKNCHLFLDLFFFFEHYRVLLDTDQCISLATWMKQFHLFLWYNLHFLEFFFLGRPHHIYSTTFAQFSIIQVRNSIAVLPPPICLWP